MIKEPWTYHGEGTVSSTDGAGRNRTAMCKRMNLDHGLTPHTRASPKWIKDLNVTHETINLLEKNMGKNLLDMNTGDFCMNIPPRARARETDAKMNKGDETKLKSLCSKEFSCTMGEYIHKGQIRSRGDIQNT